MSEFAIIDNGVIVGFKNLDEAPVLAGKPYRQVLPVERSTTGTGPVTDSVVTAVLADKVTVVTTLRAKTAQELDDEKTAQSNAFDLVALKIAFNHENRIRALEAKAPITLVQFKAAIKALL